MQPNVNRSVHVGAAACACVFSASSSVLAARVSVTADARACVCARISVHETCHDPSDTSTEMTTAFSLRAAEAESMRRRSTTTRTRAHSRTARRSRGLARGKNVQFGREERVAMAAACHHHSARGWLRACIGCVGSGSGRGTFKLGAERSAAAAAQREGSRPKRKAREN